MPIIPLDTDEDPVRTPPQTERVRSGPTERGFGDEDAPEDLGRIKEFDDLDSDSDIADEDPGHRG
jgi:hypothetical protein